MNDDTYASQNVSIVKLNTRDRKQFEDTQAKQLELMKRLRQHQEEEEARLEVSQDIEARWHGADVKESLVEEYEFLQPLTEEQARSAVSEQAQYTLNYQAIKDTVREIRGKLPSVIAPVKDMVARLTGYGEEKAKYTGVGANL